MILKEWMEQANSFFRTLIFRSTTTIKAVNTGSGWEFHYTPIHQDEYYGGEIYKGYFTAKNSSDDTGLYVTISAGRARINIIDYEIEEQVIEITDTGYIYLQSESGDEPTIEFDVDYPVYESGYYRRVIAVITLNDDSSSIASIIQQSYGTIEGFIFSTCAS